MSTVLYKPKGYFKDIYFHAMTKIQIAKIYALSVLLYFILIVSRISRQLSMGTSCCLIRKSCSDTREFYYSDSH